MSRLPGAQRSRTTIGVLVGDGVQLLELAIPSRVFGVDLSSRGVPRFELITAADRPGPVTTAVGIQVRMTHTVDALDRAGVLIVPGWREPPQAPIAPAVIDVVRRAHDEGAIVMGLCLGAFVLARAGLLDGRRATTHWLYSDVLAELHPTADVCHDVLYVDEGRVITSAGSAAGIDACLHLLRREHGAAVANTVARTMVVAPQRAGGQAQFIEYPVPTEPCGDTVGEVMAYALERLDDPRLDVAALAAHAHMGRRTFDRRFRQATGCSPLQWLLRQRILRAQHLLERTTLEIDAVARRCGFSDAVALRPHFRRCLGVSPQAYRATFRTTVAA